MNILAAGGYDDYQRETFSSDDITFDTSTGKLSFSKGGAYEITFSQIVSNVESDTTTEWRIYTTDAGGDETMVYRAPLHRDNAYDPVCNTYRAILEVEAGGKMKFSTQAGGNDIYMHAGSTMVVNRLTGRYARVHLSGNTRNFYNINPFTASFQQNQPEDKGLLINGLDYDLTHGRLISSGSTNEWGSDRYGIYAVAFNGIFGTTSVGGITLTASQNGSEFYNTTGLNINTHDPGPIHNFHILRKMRKDDYISLYAQNYSVTDVIGAALNGMQVGTTFALYEIPNHAFFSATIQGRPTEDHDNSAVNNGDSLGIAGESEKNVWIPGDSDVWAGIRSGSITVHADSPNINYDPANGKFTVKRSGVYQVNAVTKIRNSSIVSGILTKRLYVNGVAHITGAEDHVHPNENAYNHAVGDIITLLTLSGGDTIHVTHESTVAFKFGNGSCMTIFQVGSDWKYKDNDYSVDQRPSSDELIDGEFNINTYGTGSKNIQFKRDVFQSPFVANTPGPLSLRGKVEVDKLSSTLNEADAERYLFTKKQN